MKLTFGAGWLCFLLAGAAAAQTVVEMDLPTASSLLESHNLNQAPVMLEMLTSNYKKFTNVRVVSHRWGENLAQLAQALRQDFDGSGSAYIPEHNIWKVSGATGGFIYIKASLVDQRTVLLAEKLDMLRSMIAFEILQFLKAGRLGVQRALEISRLVGVEMQVDQDEDGSLLVVFFGGEKSLSRLVVVEPPELIWD